MTEKKKKNFITAYFTPFGLKQACDIFMVVGAILMIVGMAVSGSTFVVALVGAVFMTLGAIFALMRTVTVLLSNINKRSATYKNAVTNTVIMGVVFLLALFAIIYISIALL